MGAVFLLSLLWMLMPSSVLSLSLQVEATNCSLRDTCSLQRHLVDERAATCSCHDSCALYGDCCHDHPHNWEASAQLKVPSCRLLRPFTFRHGIYIIDRCPAQYPHLDMKDKCENGLDSIQGVDSTRHYFPKDLADEEGILSILPVSSQSSGLLYRNVYCALCHGVQDTSFWDMEIETQEALHSLDEANSLLSTFRLAWRRLRVKFSHAEHKVTPCRINVIETCPPQTSPDLISRCRGTTSRVFHLGLAYKNKFCAVCNGVNETQLSCLDHLPMLIDFKSVPPTLPYAILLDLNSGTAQLKTNKVGYMRVSVPLPLPDSTNCSDILYDPLFNVCSALCDTPGGRAFHGCHNLSGPVSLPSDLILKFDAGLAYLTLAGSILSQLGLLVVLAVYASLPSLRNTPGKSLMCLAGSLLVAQGLFMVGIKQVQPRALCITVALIIHYSFLAQFCWMNVLAFDVWRAFKMHSQSFRGKVRRRSRHFVYYSLYSWLLPGLLVGVSYLLDELQTALRPGYAQSFCWIGKRSGLLLLFAVPVAAILTANCGLFLMTARNICRASRDSDVLNMGRKEHRRRLLLYVKLAMVMGLAWVSGFLATILDSRILWYIFTILNAFQGLFLCISFVFTQKVYKAVRVATGRCTLRRASRPSGAESPLTGSRVTPSTKKSSLPSFKESSSGQRTH